MASAGTVNAGSGGSRRRSLDAEINLVPFIDLLSMCICFLLVTAVWINVGAVQVKQSRGTEAAAVAPNQLEMEARFVPVKTSSAGAASSSAPALQLELTFKRAGHVTRRQIVQAPTLAELPAALDAGLGSWAETAAATATQPLISSAMVFPRTGVSYGDLVSVMDMLRKHQIINLGVVPAGGGS